MAEDLLALLEEYAARFARGEEPDVRDYLARAGEEAGKLADLIDEYLAGVEPPEPSEERVLMLNAWLEGKAPLLELRVSRGVRRERVVDELVGRLGLDPVKRDKVAGYYHQLETGLLDPAPVDRSVFAILAETLKTRVEDLLAWRPPARAEAGEPAVAYHRVDPNLTLAAPLAPAAAPEPSEPVEPDEIDRLFLGVA